MHFVKDYFLTEHDDASEGVRRGDKTLRGTNTEAHAFPKNDWQEVRNRVGDSCETAVCMISNLDLYLS